MTSNLRKGKYMKHKGFILIRLFVTLVLMLCGCGAKKSTVEQNSTDMSMKEIAKKEYTETESENEWDNMLENTEETGKTTEEITEEIQSKPVKVLTQENVLTAIQNYCYSTNPALKDMSQEEHCFYWEVTDVTDSEYIVTYRSYTGSFVYYHVNINSGNVTTTEYVPGITDEEVPGTQTFNIWDYMV